MEAAVCATAAGRFAVTEYGPQSEADWLQRARQSDVAAFELLYRKYVDRIYALCLRMTANPSEADDCTQDAFIQAWTKLASFRGDSAFSTWLHRIAVNAVLGRMRKQRREQDRIKAVVDAGEMRTSQEDDGGMQDLEYAIGELPKGARHVFVLHAVYGYSHDETGDMLGIAAGTSKAQLHRARRLLERQLDLTSDLTAVKET